MTGKKDEEMKRKRNKRLANQRAGLNEEAHQEQLRIRRQKYLQKNMLMKRMNDIMKSS